MMVISKKKKRAQAQAQAELSDCFFLSFFRATRRRSSSSMHMYYVIFFNNGFLELELHKFAPMLVWFGVPMGHKGPGRLRY